jgi:phosphoribosyl-AMP cyclohydrolase
MIRNKVTDIETISIQRQASSSVIKCVREAITRREDGQYGIWDDDPMPVFPNFPLRLTRHYAREVHLNMKGFNIMVELDFSKTNGLIPAIAQDYKSGKVLMLAYINEASWKKTLETGEVHYWSRSRSELWHKGGTSGHVQKVKEILVDCDDDTVLFKVEQVGGAACHKGYESCFYRRVEEDGTLKRIAEKVFDPEKVYKK